MAAPQFQESASASEVWFGKIAGEGSLPSGTLSVGLNGEGAVARCATIVPGRAVNNFNDGAALISAQAGSFNIVAFRSSDCTGSIFTGAAFEFQVDQDLRETGLHCTEVVLNPSGFHQFIDCGG